MAASHLEVEKLLAVGESLGLSGEALKEYINDERVRLQNERELERKERQMARERDKANWEADQEKERLEIKKFEQNHKSFTII